MLSPPRQSSGVGVRLITYYYDENGNRSRVDHDGVTDWYEVDNADKLLWINRGATKPSAPISGQSKPYTLYGYDAFGQLIQRDQVATSGGTKKVFDFYWDADGRLIQAKRGATSVFSAGYAADGERITKSDSESGDHIYSYGLHDTNGAGWLYTPGLGHLDGTKVRKYHPDQLGSTRTLSNGPGDTATTTYRYDAYGQKTNMGGSTTDPYPTEYQFAGAYGYQTEPTTGNGLDLQYLYQRYYDPQAGRFISRDPIGWAGGSNLYEYAGNDPVGSIDPNGLAPQPPTTNPWGQPLKTTRPMKWDTIQYHPPHYDVDIKVGGGTRSYRAYPQPNGSYQFIEKGLEATDTSGGTFARRMTRLEGSRILAFNSATQRKWDVLPRAIARLKALFGIKPNYGVACKKEGYRTGLRGVGRNPSTASPLSGRSPGSGGGLGAITTIGVGLEAMTGSGSLERVQPPRWSEPFSQDNALGKQLLPGWWSAGSRRPVPGPQAAAT